MMYDLVRPLLFKLEAETAHEIALKSLARLAKLGLGGLLASKAGTHPIHVLGMQFPNPVGLAAGLDKNAEYLDGLGELGFGFIEVGTVTPKAQQGNPKPRLFRLARHNAIINRMGFNNLGMDAMLAQIGKTRHRGILGINIGKNKDTPNERAIDDYAFCLERAYPAAHYVTVNISSPNTTGLRDLQLKNELEKLVGALRENQEKLASKHGSRKPMLFKISPDLPAPEMDEMAEVFNKAKVDGVICCNTTIARDAVGDDPLRHESGGLSGHPLLAHSTEILHGMRQRLADGIALIGVGGILHGADAAAKTAAGADLVQLYSGLIYRGPRLIGECIEAIKGNV